MFICMYGCLYAMVLFMFFGCRNSLSFRAYWQRVSQAVFACLFEYLTPAIKLNSDKGRDHANRELKANALTVA